MRAEPCCETVTTSCLQMLLPESHLEPQAVTWITPFPDSLAMCSLSCNIPNLPVLKAEKERQYLLITM